MTPTQLTAPEEGPSLPAPKKLRFAETPDAKGPQKATPSPEGQEESSPTSDQELKDYEVDFF